MQLDQVQYMECSGQTVDALRSSQSIISEYMHPEDITMIRSVTAATLAAEFAISIALAQSTAPKIVVLVGPGQISSQSPQTFHPGRSAGK
jgi:hypothetical protein